MLTILAGEANILGLDGALAGILGLPAGALGALLASIATPGPSRSVLELVREIRIPGGEVIYDREMRLSAPEEPRARLARSTREPPMTVHERLTLYPPIEPYRTGMLDVGDGHTMYFEECGNPRGQPALLVHGGPGGGSNPTMRRFHDPEHYRIILFDQRGCGRSTPNASLEANTTWHLVADMERLREASRHRPLAGVRRLVGLDAGARLRRRRHPEHVDSLILRGIFLVRRAELAVVLPAGLQLDLSRCLRRLRERHPAGRARRHDRRLSQAADRSRPARALEAAKAWSVWEGSTLSLLPDAERIRNFGADAYAIAFARIECHYFVNAGFFASDGQLLDRCRASCATSPAPSSTAATTW